MIRHFDIMILSRRYEDKIQKVGNEIIETHCGFVSCFCILSTVCTDTVIGGINRGYGFNETGRTHD